LLEIEVAVGQPGVGGDQRQHGAEQQQSAAAGLGAQQAHERVGGRRSGHRSLPSRVSGTPAAAVAPPTRLPGTPGVSLSAPGPAGTRTGGRYGAGVTAHATDTSDPLAPIMDLPGVADAAERARAALGEAHRHKTNRRGWPQTATEAAVRAARASAAIDGGD